MVCWRGKNFNLDAAYTDYWSLITAHLPVHNNITQKGLEIVFNALEKNKTMLYLYHAQYGVKIDKKLMNKLKEKIRENIKNNLGITLQEFVSNKLRYIKHTDKIKYIDSIYRNNM